MICLFLLNFVSIQLVQLFLIFTFISIYSQQVPVFIRSYLSFFNGKLEYLLLLSIVFCFALIIGAFLPSKKIQNKQHLQTINLTLLFYKLLLIPFFILLFVFALFVSAATLVAPFLLGISLLFVPLAAMYAYLVLLSSSVYSIRVIFSVGRNNSDPIPNKFKKTLLLLLFVTDVFTQVSVYKWIKDTVKP